MAAFNIQEALTWKEKIESVIDQPKSCSRAMKAVGVVEASCEDIFEHIIEHGCYTVRYGSSVEEVDEHTTILYERLQLDWFPTLAWPRDLCYVRYWRRNDDGSYVVLFHSTEHEKCGRQPGFVRAHIESGGYTISPLKSRNGRPRTQVQHLMQIDLRGWAVGYISSFQHHCLLQLLNSVAGLREWFSQTDEKIAPLRIPVMVNMASATTPLKKSQSLPQSTFHIHKSSFDGTNRKSNVMLDDSDEEDDQQIKEKVVVSAATNENEEKKAEESSGQIDLSCFSGILRQDDHDNARNCWRILDGNNFRVRSKNFCYDKSKVNNLLL
ncbi:protein ENHANCED DISEASE RESISTANCE 2-like [Impatiens glandulifera]|uniref:protein ENHANCED DISEASE RESISTANCE 2-like n=1 Tax=Impatiens glandulifera TaxID=253017 RepID=UPI001FB1729B|nr:protein ENHANCED DISEASE RESISTANCE 2-like [Impatiens glandulifera]